jgi:hypothetical protein
LSKRKVVYARAAEKMRILTRKTIFAPVVILIWHEPQQQGPVRARHHMPKIIYMHRSSICDD